MTDFTPLLKLYAKRRRGVLARLDNAEAQRRQLASLVRQARDTAFGREHGFASIKTVADFQKAVPLRRYDDFWRTYWKGAFPVVESVTWPGRVPYFAVTSGTTSGSSTARSRCASRATR